MIFNLTPFQVWAAPDVWRRLPPRESAACPIMAFAVARNSQPPNRTMGRSPCREQWDRFNFRVFPFRLGYHLATRNCASQIHNNWGGDMPKYLFEVHYTVEGAKGVPAEGGTKRREAAAKAIKSVGGKMEAFYFAFGNSDAIVILDGPDNLSVAAASFAIAASGGAAISTTVLLTPAEVDEATKKTVAYRAPGQ
jgi:uncharacterized protein with GYD domain